MYNICMVLECFLGQFQCREYSDIHFEICLLCILSMAQYSCHCLMKQTLVLVGSHLHDFYYLDWTRNPWWAESSWLLFWSELFCASDFTKKKTEHDLFSIHVKRHFKALNTIHCQPYLPKPHSSFNSIVKPPKETSMRHVTGFVMGKH